MSHPVFACGYVQRCKYTRVARTTLQRWLRGWGKLYPLDKLNTLSQGRTPPSARCGSSYVPATPLCDAPPSHDQHVRNIIVRSVWVGAAGAQIGNLPRALNTEFARGACVNFVHVSGGGNSNNGVKGNFILLEHAAHYNLARPGGKSDPTTHLSV